MRTFLIAATALAVGACGSSPVYTDKQRDQVVSLYERHCSSPVYGISDTLSEERVCPSTTYLLYKLDNGQQFVGRVDAFNRATGRLKVIWQASSTYVERESFYPGSSQALAGKVTEVVTYDYEEDSDNARWSELNAAFDEQVTARTMRR